ncbi:hypothetical protein [Streptomyces sp. SID5910]|uniref:hypothetical protein n=1 Tax=Streptomyces sp. SID5910 TaxID=2690312 RepID=UPI00136F7AAB|nr:hypothetical protein [Streptomyces sp. SID5910]MYR43127.1 hypothetical protein [Streptomyces sp. SID5910]
MKLDDDVLITLERLEHVDDAPLVATYQRSLPALVYLVAARYVEDAGPGRMRITDAGRQALADHRAH